MDTLLGYHHLLEILPERRPLLMLDRVRLAADGRSLTGLKGVSMNEDFFQGHFPGQPIMPGVLQVAAMAQAGAVLLLKGVAAPAGKIPWLRALSRIKFRKPVSPGDQLVITARVEAELPDGAVAVYAETLVGGEVTCQGNLEVVLLDVAAFAPVADEFAPDKHVAAISAEAPKMSVLEIMKIIPHRFPFLLVDRLLAMDVPALHVVGLKQVTGNEPLFAALPVAAVPLYIQVEMSAQAGCNLALSIPENQGKLGIFMAIDEARFHAPLLPGDQAVIDTTCVMRSRFGKGEAKIYVGERLVSEGTIKFAILDREATA